MLYDCNFRTNKIKVKSKSLVGWVWELDGKTGCKRSPGTSWSDGNILYLNLGGIKYLEEHMKHLKNIWDT